MKNKKRYLPFLFCLISLLVYLPTYKSGMVTDFMGWMYKYQNGSFADIIHCFGYTGLHQFFHFFNYSFYAIFGVNHLPWAILFALSHGFVSYLLYRLFYEIMALFKLDGKTFVALTAAGLFLLSPYQTETLTWKACFHYIMSVGLMSASFLLLLKYIRSILNEKSEMLSGNKSRFNSFLIASHLLFFCSLFTLEINLATPFIFLTFYGLYCWLQRDFKLWRKLVLQVFVPHIIFLFLFFGLTKIIFGDWVGHYGAEKHLNFSPVLLFSNGFRYFFKYSLYTHYLPFKPRLAFYESLAEIRIIIPIILSFAALFAWVLYRREKWNKKIVLAAISLLGFFMAIFPVVNLFFMNITIYENDRYGYFASPFMYLCLALLFSTLPRYSKWLITGVYIIATLFFLRIMITNAYHAGNVNTGLAKDFRWYDKKEVVVLCGPENYGGMYLFRDYTGDGVSITETLDWFTGKKFEGNMIYLSQFNMKRPGDKIGVQVLSDKKLKVMQAQDGTWFWKDGKGMADYENELFKVDLQGWFYTVDIKKDHPDRVYIHSVGDKWREVKFEQDQ